MGIFINYFYIGKLLTFYYRILNCKFMYAGSRLVPIVEVVGCWQCAVGDAKCWTNSIKSSKGRKPERIQPLASTSTSQDTFVSLQSNSPDTESPNTNILESPSPSISSQGICTSTTVESDQNATHDRSTEDTVQSSNNRDTKLKSSKLSFKSNNYKTFTLGESLEVSGIEGECCHTSEGRMSSPMLCVEYCERVLPSSSFSCYSIDPDAIIGPWRTRILVLHHNSIAVTVQWCVAIRDAINRELESISKGHSLVFRLYNFLPKYTVFWLS